MAEPTDAIHAALVRADELLKAAPNRPAPDVAMDQASAVLEQARDHLHDVDDDARRRDLAVQIARRMGDIDAATFAAVEPAPGMRRAPTQVEDPRRLPPGQRLTPGWPVLHVGAAPIFDPDTWNFTVTGRVDRRIRWDWEGFCNLPATRVTSDLHCVTHWSRLDNAWEGVRARDVLAAAGVRAEATHAVVTGHPAYAANLPLSALLDDDVLFAWAVDGAPLPVAHGGPLRLVVPSRYGWKVGQVGLRGAPDGARHPRLLGGARLPRQRRPVARAAVQVIGSMSVISRWVARRSLRLLMVHA